MLPQWVGLQMVVKVNRLHPFYTVCYGEIANRFFHPRFDRRLGLNSFDTLESARFQVFKVPKHWPSAWSHFRGFVRLRAGQYERWKSAQV